MNDLRVRLATNSDVPALLRLYQNAQQWLAGRGLDQWAKNTADTTRVKLQRAIQHDECYVLEAGSAIVGMVTVDDYADPEFWRTEDRPAEALYIHRMVIDRLAGGKNLGAKLLDWAEKIAASKDRNWLRLDAWRTNTQLHRYYEKQGFELVRVVNLPHRGSGALFQRAVSPQAAARRC